MPLEYIDLEPILEPIIEETLEKVRAEIIKANRMGTLDLVLDKYGVEADSIMYDASAVRTGDTILVLGALGISKDDIANLLRKFKIKEKSIEFVDYDDVTNFSFSKLVASSKYTDVFVGPVPHKAMDIGADSGVIEHLQNNSDINAKVSVLRDSSGELKISKKTLRKALEESCLLNYDIS